MDLSMDTMYSLEQVRSLMYQAYKQGQGGNVVSDWHSSRLSLQNRRFSELRQLFPRIFGKHPCTEAAARRRAQKGGD